jgi:FAD/FMN-containing dehydrogenase
MNRRDLLKSLAKASLVGPGSFGVPAAMAQTSAAQDKRVSRVRPGDAGWPSQARWKALADAVGGRLVKLDDPLAACRRPGSQSACDALFKALRNPYFISDDPALTETSGWVDAWVSAPSAYAVKARTTGDVVAAVNFARDHNLRLVIKGGGHSYQGTSNAPDSLLIWTREMNAITLHDSFVPRGCNGTVRPQPAVTVETGARWVAVYNAVTTRGGRYVQGGGCATVGVAGLISSGGFGSFSKKFGQAAAALLEAEIVTADGTALIVNACNHNDLFWGIKGGGGGSLGVLTKLTLRTRELPTTFGGAFARVKAKSDAAFRELIARTMRFYAESLLNPHWGEQIVFGRDNSVRVAMVLQGLDQSAAEAVWRPFMTALSNAPDDFAIEEPLRVLAAPARHFWDAEFFAKNAPGLLIRDDRPGSPADNVFWAGDAGQVGQFLHGYKSRWLPASLLSPTEQPKLVEAVFAATRHWSVSFHFNKGLAGAPAEDVEAARDTAMHPSHLNAFALAIIAGQEPPAFPGIPGHEPNLAAARANARAIATAADELAKVAPGAGSYVSEADFFEPDWKRSYWGANFDRLAAVKKRYDPEGLFFTHHGVGSDEWSPDGFTRLARP